MKLLATVLILITYTNRFSKRAPITCSKGNGGDSDSGFCRLEASPSYDPSSRSFTETRLERFANLGIRSRGTPLVIPDVVRKNVSAERLNPAAE